MRKLLVLLGMLVAIVLVAAVIGPSFVDWSRYKGDIATLAKQATGRELAIDGGISLSLLPTPALSVQGVRLANLPGAATPDMMRLKALEMRVALAPLLRGRIQVESLELVEPQLVFERLADGRINWRFVPEGPAAASAASSGDGSGGGSGGALPAWIQLDRLAIRNGAVSYRDDGSGRVRTLDRIDGTLGMAAQGGPFRAQGQASLGAVPVSFNMSLERLGGERPAALNLKLSAVGSELDFVGNITPADSGDEVAGFLRASGADLRGTAAAFGVSRGTALPAFLGQTFGLEGALTASSAKLALKGLALRLGDTEATGGLTLEPGTPARANLTLALNRVDLDKWLAVKDTAPPAGSGQPATASPPAAPDTGQKPAADTVETKFILPSNIDATADVTLDALVFRGGAFRQLRFGVTLHQGELALNQLTASLPGSSDLTLYGSLRAPGGQPSFTGNLEAASDNLRGLLDWLKIDASRVPAERLRKLSLTAALQLTPAQLQLRDLDVNLDSSHLVGGATVLMQERPAFGASVAIDRLNLDAYLPQESEGKPAAQPKSATAPAAVPTAAPTTAPTVGGAGAAAASFVALRFLESFDANVRARIDELIYRGDGIRGIRLDGTVQGGAVTLREARVDDLAGLKGFVSGSLTDVASKPAIDVNIDVGASELATLLRFAAVKAPLPVDQLGAFALKGKVKGDFDKLAVDLGGKLMGGTYQATGSVGLASDGMQYDLAASADHPDFAKLLRLLAPGYRPQTPKLGPFKLQAKATGDAGKFTLADLKGQLGSISFGGSLDETFAGARPKYALRLETGAIDLNPFLTTAAAEEGRRRRPMRGQAALGASPRWSTTPLELAALRGNDAEIAVDAPSLTYGQFKIDGAKLAATLSNGVLDLAGLTGKLYGGDLKLAGRLDARSEPKATLALKVTGADLGQAGLRLGEVRIAKGTLAGNADLATDGRSELALVQHLNGNGALNLQNGVIEGFDLQAANARLGKIDRTVDMIGLVQAAMSGGASNVKRVDGTFTMKNGVAENKDLVMEADGATGKGAGIIDLPRWYMEYGIDFKLTGAADVPPFAVKLKGAPDAPRKFVNANALQEYLLKRAAGSALKNFGKGSKNQSSQPDAQGTPATKTPSTKNIIQDLLKALPKKQ